MRKMNEERKKEGDRKERMKEYLHIHIHIHTQTRVCVYICIIWKERGEG